MTAEAAALIGACSLAAIVVATMISEALIVRYGPRMADRSEELFIDFARDLGASVREVRTDDETVLVVTFPADWDYAEYTFGIDPGEVPQAAVSGGSLGWQLRLLPRAESAAYQAEFENFLHEAGECDEIGSERCNDQRELRRGALELAYEIRIRKAFRRRRPPGGA